MELGSGSPRSRAEVQRHSPACTQVPGDSPSGAGRSERRSAVCLPALPSPPCPLGPSPECAARRTAVGPGVGASSRPWGCEQATDSGPACLRPELVSRPPLRTTLMGHRGSWAHPWSSLPPGAAMPGEPGIEDKGPADPTRHVPRWPQAALSPALRTARAGNVLPVLRGPH